MPSNKKKNCAFLLNYCKSANSSETVMPIRRCENKLVEIVQSSLSVKAIFFFVINSWFPSRIQYTKPPNKSARKLPISPLSSSSPWVIAHSLALDEHYEWIFASASVIDSFRCNILLMRHRFAQRFVVVCSAPTLSYLIWLCCRRNINSECVN